MDEQVKQKIDAFFTQFKQQKYKKGEILVRADEDPSGIFYLKEGSVRQYIISKKGDESVLNVFKPVSFFPMSWAINKTPNAYNYEAATELLVWKAPSDQTVEFIKQNPDVLFNLVSRLYKGMDGILQRMSYLMSGSAYSRLLTELIIYAKRLGKKTAGTTIEIDMTENELAHSAGMSRETVSREMKKIKEQGIVLFSNHTITIPDLQLLEDALENAS